MQVRALLLTLMVGCSLAGLAEAKPQTQLPANYKKAVAASQKKAANPRKVNPNKRVGPRVKLVNKGKVVKYKPVKH